MIFFIYFPTSQVQQSKTILKVDPLRKDRQNGSPMNAFKPIQEVARKSYATSAACDVAKSQYCLKKDAFTDKYLTMISNSSTNIDLGTVPSIKLSKSIKQTSVKGGTCLQFNSDATQPGSTVFQNSDTLSNCSLSDFDKQISHNNSTAYYPSSLVKCYKHILATDPYKNERQHRKPLNDFPKAVEMEEIISGTFSTYNVMESQYRSKKHVFTAKE